MTLAPLLNASLPIKLHALPALAAFVLGALQLALPKGTFPHRTMGWIWVCLMALVAVSSFWIHTICTFGGFSLIHALSVFTLVALPVAVWRAHRHQVEQHRRAMLLLFLGALVIAGGFTLTPGRIMHDVVTGTATATSACPVPG